VARSASLPLSLFVRRSKLAMAQNFDRRRINGPEESYPPVFDDEDDASATYSGWVPGQPRRGREPAELRPICAPTLCIDDRD
jgi:hypothetical protein